MEKKTNLLYTLRDPRHEPTTLEKWKVHIHLDGQVFIVA